MRTSAIFILLVSCFQLTVAFKPRIITRYPLGWVPSYGLGTVVSENLAHVRIFPSARVLALMILF